MAGKHERAGAKEVASAEYIANLCNELAELAERSGFHTGSYLLKMAYLEFTEQRDRHGQDPENAA